MFKFFYDGSPISMEKFIRTMEINDAHNDFIEWEYNVTNFPGITSHSWSWGLYSVEYSEDTRLRRKK